MRKTVFALSCAALALAGTAQAQVTRTGAPTATISSLVTVPAGYASVYVAGTTASTPGQAIPETMDSKAQTTVILEKIKALLAAEGLGLGDIVKMNVYLVGVPSKGGAMDSAGMNESYRTFFGTADQPNKPVRATVQVAALGSPTTLVEIEATAAKKP
jgi:enamine deaminase RidA (YjgF/YER057c/UK114 family)